jgi:Mg-chelatase subunit ChlD
LADVLDDVLESLSADIADIREQILGQDSGLDSVTMGDLDTAGYTDKSVTNSAIDGARDFGLEMEQLKLKHDPAWQFEVDSGRLNVFRVINGCEPDRAFDVFQDGNDDATQIESVVCLDISGSMGNIIQDAYRAMYQIKAGLETIQGASCSVLTYNGETEVLYRADEPAGSTVRDAGCGGGTDGEKAVRFANNILAESDKAIKLLFVICDGDLGGVESYVAKMRQAGVMTVLAWVGGAYSDPATAPHFNFEVVASANTPTDLVSIARRVVNLAVERKVGA